MRESAELWRALDRELRDGLKKRTGAGQIVQRIERDPASGLFKIATLETPLFDALPAPRRRPAREDRAVRSFKRVGGVGKRPADSLAPPIQATAVKLENLGASAYLAPTLQGAGPPQILGRKTVSDDPYARTIPPPRLDAGGLLAKSRQELSHPLPQQKALSSASFGDHPALMQGAAPQPVAAGAGFSEKANGGAAARASSPNALTTNTAAFSNDDGMSAFTTENSTGAREPEARLQLVQYDAQQENGCGPACERFIGTLERAARNGTELPPHIFDDPEVPIEVRRAAWKAYRGEIEEPLAREFFGTLYSPQGRARVASIMARAAVTQAAQAQRHEARRRREDGRRYAPPTAAERTRARAERRARYDDDCHTLHDRERERCWEEYGSIWGSESRAYTGCLDRARDRYTQCLRGLSAPGRWDDSDVDDSPRRDPPRRR